MFFLHTTIPMNQLIGCALIVMWRALGPLESALKRWKPDFAMVWLDPSIRIACACTEAIFQLSPPDPPPNVSERTKPLIWFMVTGRLRRTSAPLVLPLGQVWLWLTLGSS